MAALDSETGVVKWEMRAVLKNANTKITVLAIITRLGEWRVKEGL